MVFLETKNGKARRIPIGPSIRAVLNECPQGASSWVFVNARTQKPFTVNGMAHVLARALKRARIASDDVTLHPLRHTALSRMIASGYDAYTVMAISGHSSTRMLARYTHPTEERKVGALESVAESMGRNGAESETEDGASGSNDEILLGNVDGRDWTRTSDLPGVNGVL
jgi:integrase